MRQFGNGRGERKKKFKNPLPNRGFDSIIYIKIRKIPRRDKIMENRIEQLAKVCLEELKDELFDIEEFEEEDLDSIAIEVLQKALELAKC